MYAYYPARKRISASVSPVQLCEKEFSKKFIRLLLRLRPRTHVFIQSGVASDSDLC